MRSETVDNISSKMLTVPSEITLIFYMIRINQTICSSLDDICKIKLGKRMESVDRVKMYHFISYSIQCCDIGVF